MSDDELPPGPLPYAAPAIATRYPELGLRIRSILVDTIVLVALMFLAANIFERWNGAPEDARKWAFLFIWFGYEPLLMVMGGTIGNRVMGIRVRTASDEAGGINILRSYVRYFVKLPLGWLAFVTVGANERRQAVHDLAAGTVMTFARPR